MPSTTLTSGDDDFTGTDDNDTVFGAAGNDDIHTGGGDDLAFGGSGSDTLSMGSGNDQGYGGDDSDLSFGGTGDDLVGLGAGNDQGFANGGNDTVYGGAGNDRAGGGAENDLVFGGAGADLLYGDGGNDEIYGGTENDTIYSGDGSDTLGGGAGDDLFFSDSQSDVIYGSDGLDTAVFEGNRSRYRVDQQGDRFTVTDLQGDGGSDTVYGVEHLQFADRTVRTDDIGAGAPGGGGGGSGGNPPPQPKDVITFDEDGTIDVIAQAPPGEPINGSGNDADNYAVARNETDGFEAALQIKARGGEAYNPTSFDADDRIAVFEVPAGPQEGTSNRAAWNFDYSLSAPGTAVQLDDAIAFLKIDVDPSEATDFIELRETDQTSSGGGRVFYATVTGADVAFIPDDQGNADVTQNSQNYGFGQYRNQIDSNPGMAGIQPYDFGRGEFTIVAGFRDDAGNVIIDVTAVVQVAIPDSDYETLLV